MFCKVDDYWEPAKKQLLADAKGFMDSLVKFDKDNIPDRIIKKVSNAVAGVVVFYSSRVHVHLVLLTQSFGMARL